MAYATQLTIGTGNKVSVNYQSQDVSVALTYQLERDDANVLQVVQEKAVEVALAHQMAWQRIRDAKMSGTGAENIEAEGIQTPRPNSPASEENPTPQAEPPGVSSAKDEASAQDLSTQNEAATIGQQAALRAILSHIGWSEEQMRDYLMTHFSGDSTVCNSIEQLTQRQASQWLLELQHNEREKARQQRHRAVSCNGKSTSS